MHHPQLRDRIVIASFHCTPVFDAASAAGTAKEISNSIAKLKSLIYLQLEE